VAINRWPSSAETIRLLKADVCAKGLNYRVIDDDITGGIKLEAEAVREVSREMQSTDDMTFSSSRLLNQYLSLFSKDVVDYLEAFRRRYSGDGVLTSSIAAPKREAW
jgi:hypothetical protein